MEQEIARYSYIMIVALIVSSLFNYLYQVVMGILLPKHEFGILGVSLAILFIAAVLTQNTFSWSGTRRMAFSSQMEEVSRIFRTVLAGNLTLALAASAFIILCSYRSKTYLIPNTIVALTLIFSAFVQSYTSLIRAMKRFHILASANITVSSLRLLFAVILVMLGMGAVGAIAGLLISIAVVSIYLAYYTTKMKLPPSKGFVKDLIPETFYVSIIFIGISFMINSSIIFMRWLSGSDVLAGDYNAALTIARGPFFITAALITVLFPYISSPNERREEFAFQSIKYMILLVFPICVSMAVDPKTWLNLFFGQKYMGGAETLRILSIGIGLTSLAFMISSNLVAFERVKFPAMCILLGLIVQITVIFLLRADPALTSAFSVVISSMITAILLSAYYIRRFYFKYSMGHVLKITIAYLAFSAIFLAVDVNGRMLSLVEILVSFLIYFVVLSVLNLFDKKDVDVLFSPLPKQSLKTIRNLVAKLNSIGR